MPMGNVSAREESQAARRGEQAWRQACAQFKFGARKIVWEPKAMSAEYHSNTGILYIEDRM
jgi:hypothetical protein